LSQAMGVSYKRQITQGEATNKIALSKSLFCVKSISKGEIITEHHVKVMSPGNGLSPKFKQTLLGRPVNRDIEAGQVFFYSDLNEKYRRKKLVVPEHFKWCIPVRHRDIYKLYDIFSPPAVEFHLSFKDLLIDDETVLTTPLGCEVIIHAPEQFDGDFIIDLFSSEQEVVGRSVELLNLVFVKARKISGLIGYREMPKVIVNCGGHSTTKFLSDSDAKRMIDNFVANIKLVDFTGCRFLAQTMPPYPWHFGGQSFHNQFTSSKNINLILDSIEVSIELCLDISHSYMWCNFSGEDFKLFIDEISDRVSHIHISDAAGESEEGLQIGNGDIDFNSILVALKCLSNRATLLPEIWQGHDDDGNGFRIALKHLEDIGY